MKGPGVEAENIICKWKWQREVDEGYTVFVLDYYRGVVLFNREPLKVFEQGRDIRVVF